VRRALQAPISRIREDQLLWSKIRRLWSQVFSPKGFMCLKILAMHNEYRQRSGDPVVEAEVQLLRSAGYDVETLIFSNTGASGVGRARYHPARRTERLGHGDHPARSATDGRNTRHEGCALSQT
jgi:hypothetical protein